MDDYTNRMLEEHFFFIYHLHLPPSELDRYTPEEKEWLIKRFKEQKEKEDEALNDK